MKDLWIAVVIIVVMLLIGTTLLGCASVELYETEKGKQGIRSYGFPPPKGKIDGLEIEPVLWPNLLVRE